MNLHQLFFTKNDCYIAGKPLKVQGVMVHSTGANNPNLKRYVGPDDGLLGENQYHNYWNQARPGNRQVCVHGFIGKLADGTIASYQTLPWDMRGWHGSSGAKGSVNNTHIGFEICEDNLQNADYFNAVYKEAVELTAHLCQLFDLNPLADGVVICHSEGYTRGIASNHSDVMNWFPKHGKNMTTFRNDVHKLMTAPEILDVGSVIIFMGGYHYESSDSIKGYVVPAGRAQITKFQPGAKHPYHIISTKYQLSSVHGWVDANTIRKYIKPPGNYFVKVITRILNIYETSDITSKVIGEIRDKGIYEITRETGNWGKLVGYLGWIELTYVEKI